MARRDARQAGTGEFGLVLLADEPIRPDTGPAGDALVPAEELPGPPGGVEHRTRWLAAATGVLLVVAAIAWHQGHRASAGRVPTIADAARHGRATAPYRQVALPFTPSSAPGLLVTSGGTVWSVVDSRITRIRDGIAGRSVQVPGLILAAAVLADSSAVWAAVLGGGPDSLRRYDPRTLRQTQVVSVPGRVYALAAANGRIWAGGIGRLYVADPAHPGRVRTITVAGGGVITAMQVVRGGREILALIGEPRSTRGHLAVIDTRRAAIGRSSPVPLLDSQSFASTRSVVWTTSAATSGAPLTGPDLVGLNGHTLTPVQIVGGAGPGTSVWAGERTWWTYEPSVGDVSCRDRRGRVLDSVVVSADPSRTSALNYPLVVAGDTLYVRTATGLVTFDVPTACE